MDKEVLERLPIRFDDNDKYFSDHHQGMPKHGFTKMFEKMIDNPKIKIMLNTDYRDVINDIDHERLIVTSPIDEFFDFEFGKLQYRCIDFQFETLDQENFQENSVINYNEHHPAYTRITEFKKLTHQIHPKTVLCKEYPSWVGEPSYPVPKKDNKELSKKYEDKAKTLKNTFFVGRLGTYKYLNIDAACGAAIEIFNKIKETN